MEGNPRRRRWLLPVIAALLVCLLAVAGVAGYLSFWMYWPAGHGPAGPAVPREPFQHAWTQRQVLLLGVGDSVTRGFGASAADRSFFNLLASGCDDDPQDMRGICLSGVMPNLQTRNIAVSASNSIFHLQQVERFPVQPPEVMGIVVITTGGNDIIHDYNGQNPREGAMYGATFEQARPWIDNYGSRLATMLDKLDVRFPGGCEIFLANIYDFTDGGGVPRLIGMKLPPWRDAMKILNAYNATIARVAAQKKNVHLVDMRGEFLGHGIDCRKFWGRNYRPADPHFWYFMNFEDPNDRGYDAIRRLFLLEMAKALATKGG